MATLRPQIIRADTLDLQDHDTPSAQDHTHQPYHPGTLGTGPPAPHHGQSLRTLDQDRSAEQSYLADAWGSGRSSHEGSDLLNDDQPDYEDDDENDTNDRHNYDRDHAYANGGPGDEMTLEDAAIQSGGGESNESSDADDDLLDDRISSSPSIPDDEAAGPDEGFVWALHNFVATVEGQANATKGDSMVLLDDSNSYWWLVRVIKDSSIGYLPAEHVETHTERLARYNKHRNLEFSQTMLTDTHEKSKNPLKKAMRRRNAKQVQFSTPTFYDPPSELDWSDVENESENEDDRAANDSTTENQQTDTIDKGEEIESLGTASNGLGSDEVADSSTSKDNIGTAEDSTRSALDTSRPDQENVDPDATQKRSRNGTMRNTDSFFNDNTAEPRKISLTPNLLREESEDGQVRSFNVVEVASDSQESFEHIEKPSPASPSVEKPKDDKKKKEKKPGMLSGLFKRKDKKIKVDEAAGGTVVKHEDDSGSPVLTPGDSGSPNGRTSPTAKLPQTPQQSKRPSSSGKLSKAPPSSSPKQTNELAAASAESSKTPDSSSSQPPTTFSAIQAQRDRDYTDGSAPMLNDPSGYLSKESAFKPESDRNEVATVTTADPTSSAPTTRDLTEEGASPDAVNASEFMGTSQTKIRPEDSEAELRSHNAERSISDNTNDPGTSEAETDAYPHSFTPYSRENEQQDLYTKTSLSPATAFNESSSRSAAKPPGLGSTHTDSSSSSAYATTPTRESSDASWNAAALKAYFDGQSNDDAKNMLILIQNQNDVTPLPLDHPTMLALGYHEHQKRLNEMSMQLDGLLQGFLARRAARPKITQR